ncbi:hypothetical protein NA57DRAFT_78326 [Rhizodiscina lignyota]|uniref:Uncharacterized protein n=1 Tax=Rhizodiscina lignyota TaxID=1504668 RepID=A0A9P4M4E9_9PEZI|nr:hypothetical protein NA57DRAFT_78326 [Rhizodiscina lignyota]
MAPTESTILSNFLLPPAPLPAIISLRKFTELFPASQRCDPQIAILYRELQHQRAMDTDDVKRNITAEVKRGEVQRREVVRARRRADNVELEGLNRTELQMELELSGPNADGAARREHTLKTILPEMDQACADMEEEIACLEEEAAELTAGIKNTIGDLSDLRYGRFNRTSGLDGDLGKEVLSSFRALEAAAKVSTND